MNKKIAFISGISGQTGSYLAELLLTKGYKVYGLVRRKSSENNWRIKHIEDKIELVKGDMLDSTSLDKALRLIKPTEIYNLAAQSFVGESFNSPIYTSEVTGIGVLKLLESIKTNCKKARVYQASSSEMFGKVQETPQTEKTIFYPRSPYGVAKVFAHHICINYRESYKMHISCGICFNHESPRRSEEFVTRKITKEVAKIKLGLSNFISLGNLNTSRDWGYAPDFCRAMYLMLQQDKPDDYIIATGKMHTLEYLIRVAFNIIGVQTWQDSIQQDPKYMRPADVQELCGDYSKIKRKLGWEPKVGFEEMIERMIKSDIKLLSTGL